MAPSKAPVPHPCHEELSFWEAPRSHQPGRTCRHWEWMSWAPGSCYRHQQAVPWAMLQADAAAPDVGHRGLGCTNAPVHAFGGGAAAEAASDLPASSITKDCTAAGKLLL